MIGRRFYLILVQTKASLTCDAISVQMFNTWLICRYCAVKVQFDRFRSQSIKKVVAIFIQYWSPLGKELYIII